MNKVVTKHRQTLNYGCIRAFLLKRLVIYSTANSNLIKLVTLGFFSFILDESMAMLTAQPIIYYTGLCVENSYFS